MRRNFDDPTYRAWRKKVYIRDEYTCQDCGAKRKLEAHHIKRWADYPALRFDVENGITLCRGCHDRIKGRETEVESRYSQIVASKTKRPFMLDILKQVQQKKKQ